MELFALPAKESEPDHYQINLSNDCVLPARYTACKEGGEKQIRGGNGTKTKLEEDT